MNPTIQPGAHAEWVQTLRARVRGEVRCDALARTLYATDASIYEIPPAGVLLPCDAADVVAAVQECRRFGMPIVARGAGTGLTGGAVGSGLQFDLSRFMNTVGALDRERRTIDVGPGVVLDELNNKIARFGLHFAPDVATSSRATIGGMIANNSCGAHSVLYGRTVDHVAGLAVVLGDGTLVGFGDAPAIDALEKQSGPKTGNGQTLRAEAVPNPSDPSLPLVEGWGEGRSPGESNVNSQQNMAPNSIQSSMSNLGCALNLDRGRHIEKKLAAIRDRNFPEIQRRFPKVLRSNGGYGLDRLGPPSSPVDAVKILCGSEGTLGVIVGARLKLVPTPRHMGLVLLLFDDLVTALGTTPSLLEHRPAAIELMDRMIIEAGRRNANLAARCGFLPGNPEALLAVEFFADSELDLDQRMRALAEDKALQAAAQHIALLAHADHQAAVWDLRKSGLGLLMSRPGDSQPYAFVEDTAVDPRRLGEYIARFRGILQGAGVEAGYYAHASVGCIHVKPVLNLKTQEGVTKLKHIAEAVTDLAIEFGGAVTGEHGDGLVRSWTLERVYGPQIIQAFREVKRLFDPDAVMNPGKIVDPQPMTENLRYGPNFQATTLKTYLDFSTHGGMAGLVGMCSGVGQCRQRLVGTMCPSYVATGDERHTTRARANALRAVLSNRGLLKGLADPQLDEVMDLCLSCKACKTECPTGVDMAKLKTEWLAQRHLVRGADRRSRLIADTPNRLKRWGRFPRIVNGLSGLAWTRAFIERQWGLDRRIPPPRLATTTFRSWYERHRKVHPRPQATRGTVILFIDTWTNHFTPQVGRAAVRLLEHAGFHVMCPMLHCCGRPAISKGFLASVQPDAEANVARLDGLLDDAVAIVGIEPSCILTLLDEYPQLVKSAASRRVAERAMMLESFLASVLRDDPSAMRFQPTDRSIIYHAHCHQKALVGTSDARALLDRAWGSRGQEIDTGCCGMAGSFGHEVEHYDVAAAIGESRLFPRIRERGPAEVAVSGFSCRTQIEHHTEARVRHLLECLADELDDQAPVGR